MVIYKAMHVYYLNKSHDLLKSHVTKFTHEWSIQSPHSGLKGDSSKPVWS